MATTDNAPATESLVAEGERQLAGRRFADAYDTLELALRADRRNPRINILLGIACLYQEFDEDAGHYFAKAVELDRDNAEARLGLAYVLMRKDNVADATDQLCDVLRIHPHHGLASKRFRELKNEKSLEAYIARLHPSMFVSLPSRRRKIAFRLPGSGRMRGVALFVILACLAVLMYTCASRGTRQFGWHGSSGGKAVPDQYYPAAIPLETDLGKSYVRAVKDARTPEEVFLSDGEIASFLTRAQHLLKGEEYNEARYIVNKLLASNADRVSLDVARQLDGFIKAPHPDRMHYNPEVGDVAEEGALYRGVHVKWLTRVVLRTNNAFLQVAPARFHGSEDDSVRVVVVGENLPAVRRGASVEVFGEVLGVDKSVAKTRVIFVTGKQLTTLTKGR